VYDYHVHSLYSDGGRFEPMLSAAVDAGLSAVGFADHCNLSEKPRWRGDRARYHRNFDLTYERRREAIQDLREEFDITVYDAVEMDYEPEIETKIESFLGEANFDYALGSVHYVGDTAVFPYDSFTDTTEAQRREFVDTYYDHVVSLIESELFEIAAHVDIVEAHPQLSGLTTCAHAEAVADALEASRTVPELNAGRFDNSDRPADFHPEGRVFEMLLDREIDFVVGTDAHQPEDFPERVAGLRERTERYGIDTVCPL
jgi:histidinol-phosphatase (PHP family)